MLQKRYRQLTVSKEPIANARNETTWNKVWGRIESIAEAVDITITKPRTVSIQCHRSNAGHVDRRTTFNNKVPVDSRPQDVCTALAVCDPNYFLSINRILVIFCTTPVGSVACERSFFALRHLKLWTRTSMSEDCLHGVAMLQVHRNTELIPIPELIYSRNSNWRYLLN